MKIKKVLVFLFSLGVLGLNAQNKPDNLTIQMQLKFNGNPIALEKEYISKNNDTLSFDVIRFYLSNVQIQYNDQSRFIEKNSYHLVDIEKPESLLISLAGYPTKTIKSITFNIGIDSLTSVSGALADDLDPTNGMY